MTSKVEMPAVCVEAHLCNTSKADRDMARTEAKFFVLFVKRGEETFGEALAKRNRVFVKNKKEALAAAKLNNATPWNFY